jgi:hypothetical protein
LKWKIKPEKYCREVFVIKKFSGSQVTLVFVFLSLLVVLAACGSKINEANFNKIKKDMSQKEVFSILGPPTESSSLKLGGLSGSSATWKSDEATISIQFLNEKVKAKEFLSSGK